MELELSTGPYSRTGDVFAVEPNKHRAVDTVTDHVLTFLAGNRKYTPCTFAAGEDDGDSGMENMEKFTITGAISYSINGNMYTKASPSVVEFGDPAVQRAGTTKRYLVGIDAAGGLEVFNGLGLPPSVENIGGNVTLGQEPAGPFVPPLPDGFAPVGVLTIETGGETLFEPGTTELDDEGLTLVYTDLAVAIRRLPAA